MKFASFLLAVLASAASIAQAFPSPRPDFGDSLEATECDTAYAPEFYTTPTQLYYELPGSDAEEHPGGFELDDDLKKLDPKDPDTLDFLNQPWVQDPITGLAQCTLGKCHSGLNPFHHDVPENFRCCRSSHGHYYCKRYKWKANDD